MGGTDRVTVQRRIAAPAGEIFTVICNPDMHVEIDGSGMLVAAPDARPIAQVGDTFAMDMDREPLGDIPLGRYQVLNTVTRIEAGRVLEWNVGGMGSGPLGHYYGYELVIVSDGETDVIHYCDWSGIPDELHEVLTFPVIPVHMLEASLENLDRIVTT